MGHGGQAPAATVGENWGGGVWWDLHLASLLTHLLVIISYYYNYCLINN